MTDHIIENKSNDRKYFTIVPNIIIALCRNPHDGFLWLAIASIAGEDNYCRIGTQELADYAGMSVGQVSNSRKHLLAVGLLKGHLHREKGHRTSVWHLEIPDLWARNLGWREAVGDGLHERIRLVKEGRQRFHLVKPSNEATLSPTESEHSLDESEHSPGETKKNPEEQPKEEPLEWDDWKRVQDALHLRMAHGTWSLHISPTRARLEGDTLYLRPINPYSGEWLRQRLLPLVVEAVTAVAGRPLTVVVEV